MKSWAFAAALTACSNHLYCDETGLRAQIDALERRQEELESELARAERQAQVGPVAADFISRIDTGDQWERQFNDLRELLIELRLYTPRDE